jgi:hypothetical protein
MSDRSNLLATALTHAARGWHVFPLWPDSKTPAVPDAWQHRATRDPDIIRRWWAARPFNIGVAVGPSGLLVVDLDAPKPARGGPAITSITSITSQVKPVIIRNGCGLVSITSTTSITPAAADTHGRDVFLALCARHGRPVPADTLIVATPSGGWHLYYRHPDDGPGLRNTKGGTTRSLGPAIDTRGHGGYVVAAGSVLAGRRYTVVRDRDPALLPGWLADLLRELDTTLTYPVPAGPVRLAGADRRAAFLNAALSREADHVRRAPKQRGNAVLWGAAVALGQLVAGGQLDETLVVRMLEQAAVADGRRSLAEARATIRSGLRRGAQRPRTVA